MHHLSPIFKYFRSLSLKTQLAVITIATSSLIICVLIFYTYRSNSNTIINQQTEQMDRLISLETQNIQNYLDALDFFSLQPRFNHEFMQILSSKDPELNYNELSTIQNLLKSLFNSRNDLLSYRIFLMNKNINLRIDSITQRPTTFTGIPQEMLDNYKIFTDSPYFRDIQNTSLPQGFIVFYRSIINIEDQRPLAVVELTLDYSYIATLYNTHHSNDDFLYILDDNFMPLYASHSNESILQDIKIMLKKTPSISGHQILKINNSSYLITFNKTSSPILTLVALKPLTSIERQLIETRNISLILTFIAILSSTVLLTVFTHMVTSPLSTLSDHLHKVGEGDFSSEVHVDGSSEISYLSKNYNQMIHQIDLLIKKTYISELNEKTARLIALEAQLNPHFLYNTLQAISTEAIINGQDKTNSMITALASMLRYSINPGDFVPLSFEIKHIQDYLLLQKTRFEDNLTFSLQIDDATLNIYIPKVSIQLLIENSIIHGMKDNRTSIDVQISCSLVDDTLIVIVKDDGIGMTEAQLYNINAMLQEDFEPTNSNKQIGLRNLSDRLKMLYNNQATLIIKSVYNKGTTITMNIPTIKETSHVQLPNHR